MPAHILAIDQGTTGTAAFVFAAGTRRGRGPKDASSDEALRIRGHADQEFPQRFPKPGWVEHDADDIWKCTEAVVRKALRAAKLTPDRLQAVGITNQRETVVAWDARTGKPLTRAIVWQDRRTSSRCDELRKEGLETFLRERTGLVTDPYFSATKMEWMLQNVPAVQRAAAKGTLRFGTIDSFLVSRLTGGAAHVTDPSNASRTMLYDLDRRGWSDELAKLFHVPMQALPSLATSSGEIAFTDEKAFGARVPISGIAGDQQAALFGQACYQPGEAKNTYGTGSFLLMNTGAKRPSSKRLLSSVAWDVGGKVEYALEGSIFTTGASVQWLRDGLGLVKKAAESEKLARSVKDTGGVRFLPALAGLAAPHWDAEARGTLTGLTRGTTRGHLVRAVLEATAYRSAEVLAAMREDSGVDVRTLRVDGGGSENGFLMQFQADILGVPVERPRVSETTALGAAALAALGAGVFASRAEVANAWRLAKRFEPKLDERERTRRLDDWRAFVQGARALYR
ncbi:MAG TPA: glycerol kinase GlpK [Candidatus Thermoplasmatota archaeon]|nr:glycerol kinase GlpK [Candidatus Thermoplasmatota archaeon]